jgi:hypothetical protein
LPVLGILGTKELFFTEKKREILIDLEVDNIQLISDLVYEFELMNQVEVAGTFDAFFNFYVPSIPTKDNF